MKKFNRYICGLCPWMFLEAMVGFATRFAVFGRKETNPALNYLLITVILTAVHTLLFWLDCKGFCIEGFEYSIIEKSAMLNCFDVSVIMILLLLALGRVRDIPGLNDAVVMCTVSMISSAASLISERNGRIGSSLENIKVGGFGAKALFAVIISVIGGLGFIFFYSLFNGVEKISEFFASIIVKIYDAAVFILKFAGNAILKFLIWLSRFIKPEDPLPPESPQESISVPVNEISEITKELSIPTWTLVLAIIALLIFIASYIRRHAYRRRTVSVVHKASGVKRENNILSGIKRLLGSFTNRLQFLYNSIKYRNTPAGLLLYCERHCEKKNKRTACESGEAFLRRNSNSKTIYELADLVEKDFYSGKKTTISKDKYKEYKKSWNIQ